MFADSKGPMRQWVKKLLSTLHFLLNKDFMLKTEININNIKKCSSHLKENTAYLITQAICLQLFREINTIYCQYHTEHKLCGDNAYFVKGYY